MEVPATATVIDDIRAGKLAAAAVRRYMVDTAHA
jgi:hypothetical protein